ncbi:hypothetical protein WDU94_001909 [Cyamophila willieti]
MKNYRFPEIHKREIQNQVESMLEQGLIRPSYSPWSSPIWIVPKKQDASGKQKWRMVVDYRKINEKTNGERYPLPDIDDALKNLGRAHLFSCLNLKSLVKQIEIDEESIEKTAFNTDLGHFEFLRMPPSLKNSSITFNRVMDHVLKGLKDVICFVHLDNIIIFSANLEEHIKYLKFVFDRLRDAGFKIHLDGSEFLKREVNYLGHVVTADGVKPNPENVKAITEYPIPRTSKELKRFIGLMGYYYKFVKNFAEITKPMTKCLKKNGKIDINNKEYIKSFELCKEILTNEPILQHPDYEKEFILTTDASNVGVGAVLSQGTIGQDLPIAFASRTLNDNELTFSTIEKELLSIIWSVRHFRPYLFGRKFKIVTDHKPLQFVFNLKEPNSKLVKWRLKLEAYDYEIVYKKGLLNTNADALSRIEVNTSEIQKDISSVVAEKDMPDNEIMVFDTPDEEPQTDNFPDLDRFSNLSHPYSLSLPIDEPPNLDLVTGENNADEFSNNTIHSNVENPVLGIPISNNIVNTGKHQIIIKESEARSRKVKIQNIHTDKTRYIVQISRKNKEKDILEFLKNHIDHKTKYYLYFETPLYEEFSVVLQKYFQSSSFNFIKCSKFLTDVTDDEEKIRIIKNRHERLTNHGDQPAEVCNKLLDFFSHHGLPSQIFTTNRGQFRNTVMADLFKVHKVDLCFTKIQHPESNEMIDKIHSTLQEHISLFNSSEEFQEDTIYLKVKYAILGYNNMIHPVTKMRPMEIITGHLDTRNPMSADVDINLLSNFINNHKNRIKLLHKRR